MFIIDIQSKVPIFEQLKKQILEFISIGILLPNDKITFGKISCNRYWR